MLFPIRARSPLICQFSNSSVHEYLKFEVAEYKQSVTALNWNSFFGRTLVQTHFFRRNWQRPPVADAGTRHFANCFLMAQSTSLWSLKAPQQKVICVVENNWFPIFLGAGNGTGTMSFCGTFFVINTGDYWIMICVPIFVKGRERYFETDIYLITSSCSSNLEDLSKTKMARTKFLVEKQCQITTAPIIFLP